MSAKNVMLAIGLALLVIQPVHGKDIPATNALEMTVRDGTKVFTKGGNVEFEYRVNFAETAKTSRVHYQIVDLFDRELVYSNEISVVLEAGKPSVGVIQYSVARSS